MAADTTCIIFVGGNNVSTIFNQWLETLTVTDKAGTTSDTASITLDDSGGQLILPQIGSSMSIFLSDRFGMSAQVFDGTVDTVRSQGGRGSGRQMMISGKGFDPKGKAKEPLEFHKDDASLSDFMQEAAGKAGLSFKAGGKIGQIKREWWGATTESFIHLGQRIAREVGGEFKIKGKQAAIYEKGSGESIGGQSLGSVRAVWGDNLLNWDISPAHARPRFAKSRARWYDDKEAKWKEKIVDIQQQGASSPAEFTHRTTRKDEDEAKDAGEENKKSSEQDRGSGSVTVLGMPNAQPNATCIVAGVRPGIDGSYKIEGVTHDFSRSGYTTKLDLKHPDGDAGSDTRKAG